MNSVLAVSRLSKRFGDVDALADVSLEVAAGEVVAVLGPSGAGKSTLFRCIARLTEPDSGSIRIDGIDYVGLKGSAMRDARKRIGVVFQQFNLVRRRSALANVMTAALPSLPVWRIASGLYPAGLMTKAEAALASVDLAAQTHQRADTLSGGQQQRVAIARALMQESRVLLVDEPVASLDPAAARLVLELICGLARSRGLGVLCTLHQPELATEFADRILSMRSGRIVAGEGGVLEEGRAA
jgi:phosphonate transport system ATP-binding protein